MSFFPKAGLAALAFLPALATATVPADHAKQFGFTSCSELLEKVADFYVDDARHGADTTRNTAATDKRMFSSFVARNWSDGDSHIFIHVVPNAAGSCDAVYTTSYALPKSCNVVREETFGGWKYRGSFNDATLLLQNEGGGVDLYLSPQDKGQICLVTRREVIYQ